MTINPVHSAHPNPANQTKTPAIPKQEAQKTTFPQDTVSLKSPDANHNRGSK
jgi:hypothetical protein